MLKKLLLLSTVASLAAFPALAQEATQQQPATGETAPTAEAEPPATPPPGEAIIRAQAADEVRADTLIGMTVFDTAGEKVGEVKDILFNENGQATGVVLSVGGVLGLGAKSVGLNWSEVDVQPDAEVVKIPYNKDQLEAAPDFKTQEARKVESDAAQIELQQQQNAPASGAVPEPAPTTTTE
ncbi:MAG: PRC-barrel domain-containing protein [Dongiaceae bacterium]